MILLSYSRASLMAQIVENKNKQERKRREKKSSCSAGDQGLIPESGRSSGEGNDKPLQYSCLENPMDRGACRATLHGVAKSQI